jgi:hypothetical protein
VLYQHNLSNKTVFDDQSEFEKAMQNSDDVVENSFDFLHEDQSGIKYALMFWWTRYSCIFDSRVRIFLLLCANHLVHVTLRAHSEAVRLIKEEGPKDREEGANLHY